MEHPRKGISDPMNALADDARSYARWLEKRSSRKDVARAAGVAPGTMENVARGRLKDPLRLRGIVDRMRSLMIAEINEEILRLEHERQILLATGADPRSDALVQAATAIADARAVLGARE